MYRMDEQDATVLKHVLPLMSHYAAGYHPISYTVWYEYARGGVVELRRDIDAHIARAERLTVPATHALYVQGRSRSVHSWRFCLPPRHADESGITGNPTEHLNG